MQLQIGKRSNCLTEPLAKFLGFLYCFFNYMVTTLRGMGLTISDIYAIGTAMNVAKGLRLPINPELVISIILFGIINFLLWRYFIFNEKLKIKNTRKRERLARILVGLFVSGMIFNSNTVNSILIWNINECYLESGAGLTLMRMVKDLKVEKPKNYDLANVYKILSQYSDDTLNYEGKLPNVIVIMNESFADLNYLFDYKVSQDNLPFYHELIKQDNVVSGVMHSSKYGGGTASVEYEFLTQNSVAFLPTGSTPYQQYITKTVNRSIVSHMNKLKYNTNGIHTWYKDGYSRAKVYNLLQFKNSKFYEDIPNLKRDLSEYTSDQSTYEYLFSLLRNRENNEKFFYFVVTVQNHLPYYHVDENAVQYVENNVDLNGYLQYANRSDNALRLLIDFLKNYDEDTILLFFGDHQPSLSLEQVYGSKKVFPDDESSYVVPFFIWANYDIEEQQNIQISTNYLPNLLFDIAKIPKDPYTKYVNDLRKEIPILTAQYYYDKDGNKYMIDDENSPYYDKLQEYWGMIYSQLFE